jgi:hypothetical protein
MAVSPFLFVFFDLVEGLSDLTRPDSISCDIPPHLALEWRRVGLQRLV